MARWCLRNDIKVEQIKFAVIMEERTLKEILDFLSHHPEEYLNAPVVECTIKIRIHDQIEEYKYHKSK